MMTSRLHVVLSIILAGVSLLACSGPVPGNGSRAEEMDWYASSSAGGDISDQLERVGESVRRVNSIAYYRHYVFIPGSRVTRKDIGAAIRDALVDTVFYLNSTASGTATVLESDKRKVALLTSAHILDFPDTLISFARDAHGDSFVRGASVKMRQVNYVADFPEGGEMEILAIDSDRDLALLGKTFHRAPEQPISRFPFRIGNAGMLRWGTFVYLMGFPMGHKVVTSGLVSDPGRDPDQSFLVDAVFQRGFSGGIILAWRNNRSVFELVGLVKSVPYEPVYYLAPAVPDSGEPEAGSLYRGDIYVRKRSELKVGLVYTVSSTAIRSFIDENRARLLKKGYSLSARDEEPGKE